MERATRIATTNINETNNSQNKKQRIHFQCWIYLCLAVLLCTIEQMCSPLVVALSVSNASMTKCLFGYFPPSSLVSSATIDFYLLSSPVGCSMPSNLVSHAQCTRKVQPVTKLTTSLSYLSLPPLHIHKRSTYYPPVQPDLSCPSPNTRDCSGAHLMLLQRNTSFFSDYVKLLLFSTSPQACMAQP